MNSHVPQHALYELGARLLVVPAPALGLGVTWRGHPLPQGCCTWLVKGSGDTSKKRPGLPEAPLRAPAILAGTAGLSPTQAAVHERTHCCAPTP